MIGLSRYNSMLISCKNQVNLKITVFKEMGIESKLLSQIQWSWYHSFLRMMLYFSNSKKYDTFSLQGTENLLFRIFWETRYSCHGCDCRNLHNGWPKIFLFLVIKVAAISLKLEVRLHAHQVGTNTWSGTKVNLCSSDWLMRSEPGYFARSFISGLNNNDTPTLRSRN